jgi:hypothetical protein
MSGYTGHPNIAMPSPVGFPLDAPRPASRMGSTVRRLPLWQGDLVAALALAILALGFAEPYSCTRLQILLTVILVLHRNPVWIPALILLQFTPTDFKGGYGGNMAVQYERFEGLTVFMFGFPLTPNFTLVLSMVLRAVLDLLGHPQRFRGVIPGLLLVPVVVAVVITAYNSVFLGFLEHVPGWSAPLRASLTSLAVWYGASIAADWEQYRRVLLGRVSLLSLAFVGVTFVAPFLNPQYCFLIPFGASCAVVFLTARDARGWSKKLTGALTMVFSLMNYLFNRRASESVIEATKTVAGGVITQTTQTVMAVVPVVVMMLRPRLVSARNRRWATPVATVFFAVYLALPFVIAAASRGVEVDVRGHTAKTFLERVTYKLFFERSSIWRGAADTLSRPPFVFVPPSRESKWITASGEEFRFRASPHNMVLHHLMSEGWLAGAINLMVIFVAFRAAVVAWLVRTDSFSGVLATTFIVGMMWDGFGIAHCVEGAVAFMLLSTGGACCLAASSKAAPGVG